MRIKKSTLRKAAAVVGGLALISVLVLVVGPVVLVDAAEPTCGDGICDTNSENNDLCPEDCQCIDNGVEDPGEGCGCKDVVCEDEGIASACGTPVGADGECPGNLVDSGGVCWDRCECQGICSEADEAAAPATAPTCTLPMDLWTDSLGRSQTDIGSECFGPCGGSLFGWSSPSNRYRCYP